ncbi:MAG TPA: bifunctional nuclease family protein [Gemmatimonadaceae bacterium]|nr:bifunctional nuclease family protein [Gemmatimonadaceae bacterium]
MIEVVVSRLGLDSSTQSYVVILQEKDGERLLPIWIGQPEAESIVMQMHNIKRVRPLTHDLCKSLIVGLGGKLQKVHITRVEKNTYYAELHIARNGGGDIVQVDARPSDSIAIALRLSAPIFASDALLTDVQVEDAPETFDAEQLKNASELSAEQLKEYLERLRPEDFGKFNL